MVISVIAEFVLAILHPPYDSPWERWGSAIADALIALGIVGEVMFGMWNNRIQTELRSRSNQKVADAVKAAADANERAAKAELETQRLKAQYAWRRFLPEQEASLRFWLGKMTGGSVIIRWFMYDIESHNLAEDIGAIFRLSGWKARLSPEAYSGNFAYGLRVSAPVTLPPSKNEENRRAADVVKTAFTNSFLEFAPLPSPQPHMMTGAHGDDVSPPCAEVYVGPKPPPTEK